MSKNFQRDEMRAFFLDLADVMERHNVSEMAVVEESIGYSSIVTGIEFSISSAYTDEGELIHAGYDHTVDVWMTPENFKNISITE